MQASSRNRIKRLIKNNSKPSLKRDKLVGVVLGKGMERILTRKFHVIAGWKVACTSSADRANGYFSLQVTCSSKSGVIDDDVVQRKTSALVDDSSIDPGSFDHDQRTVEIRYDSWERNCLGGR